MADHQVILLNRLIHELGIKVTHFLLVLPHLRTGRSLEVSFDKQKQSGELLQVTFSEHSSMM